MLPSPHNTTTVSIDTLEIVLARMGIKVPVNDIVTVIREVEEAERTKQACERCAQRKSHSTSACLFFNPTMLVAVHPPEDSGAPRAKCLARL